MNDLKSRITNLEREIDGFNDDINRKNDEKGVNQGQVKQLEAELRDTQLREEHLIAEMNVYVDNEKLITLLAKVKEVAFLHLV